MAWAPARHIKIVVNLEGVGVGMEGVGVGMERVGVGVSLFLPSVH